jgi:hypothetical protein
MSRPGHGVPISERTVLTNPSNCSIFELMRHEVDIEANVEEDDVDPEFNGRDYDYCDNRRPWSPHGGYVSDGESCVGSGDFGSAVAAPAEFRVNRTSSSSVRSNRLPSSHQQATHMQVENNDTVAVLSERKSLRNDGSRTARASSPDTVFDDGLVAADDATVRNHELLDDANNNGIALIVASGMAASDEEGFFQYDNSRDRGRGSNRGRGRGRGRSQGSGRGHTNRSVPVRIPMQLPEVIPVVPAPLPTDIVMDGVIPSNARRWYWTFFRCRSHEDKLEAQCYFCREWYAYDGASSHLPRHLHGAHLLEYDKYCPLNEREAFVDNDVGVAEGRRGNREIATNFRD